MKDKIKNVIPNNTSLVFKEAKKGQYSFRLTRALLKSTYDKSRKLKKPTAIVIKIPANANENYVVKCIVTKEKMS